MANTLVLNENKDTIEKFRSWYKTKIIDTGKASDYEAKLDQKIQREKRLVTIAGTVATIVLIFIPADGPFGELCAAAATPLLRELVELKGKVEKNVILNGKRSFEANFIKADGHNEKVDIPNISIKDFEDMKDKASSLADLLNKGKSL